MISAAAVGNRCRPTSGRARGVLTKHALSAHDRAHRRRHALRLASDQGSVVESAANVYWPASGGPSLA